jgi:hypothetical protein
MTWRYEPTIQRTYREMANTMRRSSFQRAHATRRKSQWECESEELRSLPHGSAMLV